MKKLISLLLAVSLMAMSTVAFADLNPNRSLKAAGQRNPGAGGTAEKNSDWFRPSSASLNLAPTYRPGDTITFKSGTDVNFAVGNVVTFISSYVDADDLTSASVMFIDQVTVDADIASNGFSYKVREGLAEGLYKIDIKNGDADVDTFYYLVGDPKVVPLYLDAAGTQKYFIQNGTAYYFAAASIGSADVSFVQAADAFGFDVEGYGPVTFDAAHFDEQSIEGNIEGDAVTFVFALPITGFADASELPEVETYLD